MIPSFVETNIFKGGSTVASQLQKPFYGQLENRAEKLYFFIEQGRAEGLIGVGEKII